MDYGFVWWDIVCVVGVSVFVIIKWCKGVGVIGENWLKIVCLFVFIDMFLD